jgi:tellurite resistance protein TehA-like permease
MTNEVKEGIVGVTAGVGGATIHWLHLAGDVGSAVASVLGALTAAVVFARVIRHRQTKE